MRRWHLAMLGIVAFLYVCPLGYAAEVTPTPPESAVKAKEDDRLPIYPREEWQFFVSPYIKERIDDRRQERGQYLLTGSQNLLVNH